MPQSYKHKTAPIEYLRSRCCVFITSICFLLLVFPAQAQRQELDSIIYKLDSISFYNEKVKLEASDKLLQEVKKEITGLQDTKTLAKYNLEYGIYLRHINEKDSSIYYMNLAVENLLSESTIDSVYLARVYAQLFPLYEHRGQRDLAYKCITSAVAIAEKIGIEKVPEAGDYYKQLGISHIYGGDIDKAQKSLLQSERYLEKYHADNMTKLIGTKSAQFYLLNLTGNFEEAIRQYKLLIKKTENTNIPDKEKLSLMIGLSIALRETKRYDEALAVLTQSEQICLEQKGPPNPGLGDIWNITTNIYLETNQYDKAEENILKTIKIRLQTTDEQSYYVTQAYWALGKLQLEQKEFDEAVKYYEKALEVTKYTFQNPSYFRAKRNYTSVTNSLTHLTSCYLKKYLSDGDTEDLGKALSLSRESVYALEKIKSEFTMDGSKENLIKEAYSIYENAITIAYYLHQHDSTDEAIEYALEVMEKSKMQSLQEKARTNTYNDKNKIPASLLREREKLRSELTPLRELFAMDSLITTELESKYLNLSKSLEKINQNIVAKYPQHYQHMLNQKTTTLQEVQKSILSDSLAIVHYFITDTSLYSLVLCNLGSNIYQTKLKIPINVQIDTFRVYTNKSQLTNANKILEQFSDLLVRNIPEFLSFEKIKLIPHKELWFIPFEALQQKNGKQLLYTNNISFANTLSLLVHQNNIQSKGNNKVLAFAPKYTLDNQLDSPVTRAGLSPLPGARNEVQQIESIVATDIYIDEAGTKSNFLSNVADYEILHLAMHNIIDSLGNPNLIFYKCDTESTELLSSSELSTLDLNADLAVISACNTAYGKIQSGSGIRSISHAFAYAGIPSIVMTLWQIPDESSSKIIVEFYKNLASGQPKDLALRNAKISYLADDGIPANLKTYDKWAGFVLEGNNSAIDLKDNDYLFSWTQLLLGLLAVGFVLFILKRKK